MYRLFSEDSCSYDYNPVDQVTYTRDSKYICFWPFTKDEKNKDNLYTYKDK